MKKLFFVILALLIVLGMAPAMAETYEGYSQQAFDALSETTVVRSADSPTGYFVTFRYKDPDASRVRIFGEWGFSDLVHASLNTSLNATPIEWQDGYFEWSSKGWPTADMTKDEATGIWSYTIPLPNGFWQYRFYVGGSPDAALDDYTDAVVTWDPARPPFLYDDKAEDLSNDEYLSAVYVPYDEEKQAKTGPVQEQAPRAGENGEVLYTSVKMASGDERSFGVYLPYQFDQNRAEPYPVLVLLHGGGGYEGSWINQGGIANILDNMIAENRVEPMVVVMPNGTDAGTTEFFWDRPEILNIVLKGILPYAVENYNVSTEPGRRAFCGLSMGGATTMYALFNHTNEFQYYLPLSAFISGDVNPDYTKPALKDKTVCFGGAWYDFVLTNRENDAFMLSGILQMQNSFAENDIPFTSFIVPGGHTWYTWRDCAVYMFENVLWK